MKYTASHYAKTLYEIIEADPNNMRTSIKKFAEMLAHHGKTSLLRSICLEFEREWYKRKGVTPVLVETTRAGEVPSESLKRVIGNEIDVMEKVDPSLVAGARIRIGDWRIDNTIARRMQDLKQTINT